MASSAEPLAGRTALVTGASRGIGLAVARRLSSAGVKVVMVARGEADLGQAAESVGGIALVADVARPAEAERLQARFASVVDRDAPDYLVNAAGAFELAPIVETSTAQFEAHVATNLTGPFILIRGFLPVMLERGSGHIVTLGSVAGRVAFPANGAYSASKFGVRGLHAVLDAELRGTGVRSTLIEPAATDTTLWDSVDRQSNPGLPDRSAMLDADAVADAVAWVLSRPVTTAVHNVALQRA